MLLIIVYVMASALGLVCLKLGINHSNCVLNAGGNFDIRINMYLIIGMILYILSFLTSLLAMSKVHLNSFYPISAGLVYIVVCVCSYFVLKEDFSPLQLVGSIIILIGVILMNIR